MNTMGRAAVNIASPSNIASVTDARKVVDAVYTAAMNTRKGAAVIVIIAGPSNIARVTNAREVVDAIDTASMHARG